MSSDVTDLKGGVASANGKLDAVLSAIDPANAASRCTDVWCAVMRGGDAQTIGKLFEEGAALLPNEEARLAGLLGARGLAEPRAAGRGC